MGNLLRSSIAALMALGLLIGGMGAPASAAEPAFAVPSGLKSAAQTDTSVSLSWVKSANVPRYRVQRYTKADMSDS
ncbi:hypothetical protein, partial [Arthrobacter sp. CP30]